MCNLQNTVVVGNCVELINQLDDASVATCITSPPYANQRNGLYNGVSEKDFPDWTVQWMNELKPKLKMSGSVFIVIRSHVRNGEVSDYVLKTRLAIRENGWKECEELIWHKPDAPPLGSTKRPRRTWENVLWYSQTSKPYVDLFACGNKNSVRVGGFTGSQRFGKGIVISQKQNQNLKTGTSRISDVITATVGSLPKGVMHPAMYPNSLCDVLIQTFSQENDVILDPFAGSGQTLLSASKLNRKFIGFDLSPEYVEIAKSRLFQPEITES